MRSLLIPPLAIAGLLAASGLLAACGKELSEAEQRAHNEAVVNEIRAANDMPPPLDDIVPEAITQTEIEANDLLGMACSYAPGTSGAVRLIARESDAVVKINGQLVRFAADPGSRALPANTRTLYNGTEYVLRLSLEDAPVTREATEEDLPSAIEDSGTQSYEGTMWLYDRWDRIVYTGTGATRCES